VGADAPDVSPYFFGLLGAVKDWAILADQKGPNRYNAMATNVGSPHRVLIESLPQ
jgi:hypothetical protein